MGVLPMPGSNSILGNFKFLSNIYESGVKTAGYMEIIQNKIGIMTKKRTFFREYVNLKSDREYFIYDYTIQ